jgi:hypothetical protein
MMKPIEIVQKGVKRSDREIVGMNLINHIIYTYGNITLKLLFTINIHNKKEKKKFVYRFVHFCDVSLFQ